MQAKDETSGAIVRRHYVFSLRDSVPAPDGGWTVMRHTPSCLDEHPDVAELADCAHADICRIFIFDGEDASIAQGMVDLSRVIALLTSASGDENTEFPVAQTRRAVAVVGASWNDGTDDAVHYERCMQLLHDSVKALRLATEAHTPDVTIERVWPIYMRLDELADGTFHIADSVVVEDGWRSVPTASPEETRMAEALLALIWTGDPTETYRDFKLNAQRAGETQGAYVDCVLSAAAAAEVLLKHTSWTLTWEATTLKSRDPAPTALKSPPNAETKPARLIGQVLAPRLKGDWSSQDESRPIGAWRHAIAQMRNSVIHLGRRPTYEEAREALAALDMLEQHVMDRPAAEAASYPVTALFMVGESGLERRGALGKVRATRSGMDPGTRKREYLGWLEAAIDSAPRGTV